MDEKGTRMLAEWSFLWSMVWFFFLIMYFMILFNVIGDIFRDHELGGFSKFLWCMFLLVAPFLSLFIYLIVRGDSMAKRSIAAQQQAQKQMDDYVKQTAGAGDPTTQIANAKKLLDDGAISQAEFDAIKQKALA
jgi:cell division protein FtsB